MEKHTILVTGCAGKVGKHVVKAARLAGNFVVGLDLARGVFDAPVDAGADENADVYLQVDLNSIGDIMSSILRFKPCAVIHVAAMYV
jgi:nucleoside-diphosphate-sugar epimerase